eukprot:g6130.t1
MMAQDMFKGHDNDVTKPAADFLDMCEPKMLAKSWHMIFYAITGRKTGTKPLHLEEVFNDQQHFPCIASILKYLSADMADSNDQASDDGTAPTFTA